MFKLFAFLAVLAVAFAAPAPAPAPAAILAPFAAAVPLASSSQSIVRNYNNLAYTTYSGLPYSGLSYSGFAYPQPAYFI